MSEEISIKKNYLYNAAYQLLLFVTPVITTPYISRILGPENIGIQNYHFSIATYFLLFVMLGLNNYGNRSIARVRDDINALSSTFWSIYLSQLVRSILLLICYYLYVWLFIDEYKIIALINGLYVFSGMLDINWFFFGLEKFKLTVVRNFIIKCSTIASIFLLVHEPGDLWKYSFIVVMVFVLSNGYLWIFLSQFIVYKRPSWDEVHKHLKPELVLFVPIIAVSLYKVMDRIMLGYFSTKTQVGFFASSESIINIPLNFILALGVVMLPRMSNLMAKGNIKEGKKYIEMSMIFVVVVGAGMAFGVAAIAPTFIPVFLGNKFMECIPILIGLSVTILFISWANVIRTQYLIPTSKDTSYLISIVTGAVINVGLNIILIPQYQALGAMVGTICAEGIVCILQTIMVRKELPILKYVQETWGYLVYGIIMFGIVRCIGLIAMSPIYSLILQILLGGLIYLLLCGITIWKSSNPIYEPLVKRVTIIFNKANF